MPDQRDDMEAAGFPEPDGPHPIAGLKVAPAGVTRWHARVAIEAVQLLDDDDCDWDAIAAWCGGSHILRECGDSGEYDSAISVPTISGVVDATERDWIVKHTTGFRVWEQTAFAGSFTPAEPETAGAE
jgi:hypothetical protein